ncbi:MAG: ParB/RepB/Spo0J family partition protein [Candidatus Sericytochromatia bacterium]|nr:ParB/RepB/Spo0J family partition protein [Candidatus Sericytochromatia bacterium]
MTDSLADPITPERDVQVLRVDEVPMGDVVPSPHQPRKAYDALVLASLVESIGAVGVLQRPRVREADGRYELVFGHQRAEACRQLGWERLPVEVIACSDLTARRMTLHENIKSARLHPIEHAEAIVKFLDATLSLKPGHDRVPGDVPAERIASLLHHLTHAPDEPGVPDPARAFAAEHEGLIRQVLREMANKEPKSFLNADVSLLQLPETIITTTVEKGLKKGHARALGQLLAREPNMFDEVLAKGVPVQAEDAEEAWLPLEKAPASAIRNLYQPQRRREFGDEPREGAADRRYIPIGVPGRAEAAPAAIARLDDDELPPWEEGDDALTPVFGLPLASLAEAHAALTTLGAGEWAAMILESGADASADARRQWEAIARLAGEVKALLG